ncbi:MAG: C-GCAxxG-C-C family protein [Prolixibacteraceae bacterium]|jgi:C_GCAxxG_C_C family probable redox protein|nr:C-GCAxxG-C-C family protein [Prolixibacteraceae bacterium]
MEPNAEKAISLFKAGYNCAQSVLISFKEDLGFDENLASCISVGFGGGMGRLQEKCGAVTGAFMVIGLYSSKLYEDNLSRKNHSYALIQQFDQKFREIYQTTQCSELLQCDLRSDDGHAYAVENKLFEKVCQKCIADAIGIVKELADINHQ